MDERSDPPSLFSDLKLSSMQYWDIITFRSLRLSCHLQEQRLVVITEFSSERGKEAINLNPEKLNACSEIATESGGSLAVKAWLEEDQGENRFVRGLRSERKGSGEWRTTTCPKRQDRPKAELWYLQKRKWT